MRKLRQQKQNNTSKIYSKLLVEVLGRLGVLTSGPMSLPIGMTQKFCPFPHKVQANCSQDQESLWCCQRQAEAGSLLPAAGQAWTQGRKPSCSGSRRGRLGDLPSLRARQHHLGPWPAEPPALGWGQWQEGPWKGVRPQPGWRVLSHRPTTLPKAV